MEPSVWSSGRQSDGRDALLAGDLAELQPYGFESSTPLWYYVLKEREVVEDGLHLGRVGGRIVAEVLIGLLQSDPASYLVQKPKWTPTLTSAGTSFRMKDFLAFAGVDPASRGSGQRSPPTHVSRCRR